MYFSGAELDDVDMSNVLIVDKKHIIYKTNDLKKAGETSKLLYEITNESNQYDAAVEISCSPTTTEYYDVILDPINMEVEARKIASGKITVKLKK